LKNSIKGLKKEKRNFNKEIDNETKYELVALLFHAHVCGDYNRSDSAVFYKLIPRE